MRIIGGKFRRRILKYSGDPATRPMKDRVRESVFNLVGPGIKGMLAIDLFAGTGAIGLEALSRGAAAAVFFERSHAAARVMRENIELLGVQDETEIIVADTFLWYRRHPLQNASAGKSPGARDDSSPFLWAEPNRPWCIFVSPPWDLFESRRDDLLWLIETFVRHSPPGSLIVVESDQRFDPSKLPAPGEWDVRTYAPATVSLWERHGQDDA